MTPAADAPARRDHPMMLPNGANAVIDIAKLRSYCLSTDHPRGRNKVRVFAAIGMKAS